MFTHLYKLRFPDAVAIAITSQSKRFCADRAGRTLFLLYRAFSSTSVNVSVNM